MRTEKVMLFTVITVKLNHSKHNIDEMYSKIKTIKGNITKNSGLPFLPGLPKTWDLKQRTMNTFTYIFRLYFLTIAFENQIISWSVAGFFKEEKQRHNLSKSVEEIGCELDRCVAESHCWLSSSLNFITQRGFFYFLELFYYNIKWICETNLEFVH